MGRKLFEQEADLQYALPLETEADELKPKRLFLRTFWVGGVRTGATVLVYMLPGENGTADGYQGEIRQQMLGKVWLDGPVVGPIEYSIQKALQFKDAFGKVLNGISGDPEAAKKAAEALKPVIKKAWK